MVTLAPLALGVVVAAGGTWLGVRMARGQWAIRGALKGAESARAGALEPGVVELDGTAEPAGETLTSPLTEQECLAYEYELERLERSTTDSDGSHSSSWRTYERDTSAVPFYVADGTGRALVDAPVAEFRLERAYEVDSDDLAGTAGRLLASVTGRETGPDAPVPEHRIEQLREGHRRKRARERLVLPDESVYVYGEAVSPEEATEEESAGVGDIVAGLAGLLQSGSATSPVLDMLGSAAGSEQFRRAERQGPGGGPPLDDERLVVSRGDTIREFVVSDREKGSVVRSYTVSTLKWLGLALLALLAGGYLLAVGFGAV